MLIKKKVYTERTVFIKPAASENKAAQKNFVFVCFFFFLSFPNEYPKYYDHDNKSIRKPSLEPPNHLQVQLLNKETVHQYLSKRDCSYFLTMKGTVQHIKRDCSTILDH